MNKFDVFINGIQLDYIKQNEQVINEVSDFLKITAPQAEKLLNSANTRIRQAVPEKKAQQYQTILNKIGLICCYKPCEQDIEITTKPNTENIKKNTSFFCPNCNHQLTQENNSSPPEVCNNCGISIEMYLTHMEEKEEKKQNKTYTTETQNNHIAVTQKRQKKKSKNKRAFKLQRVDPNKQPLFEKKIFNKQILTFVGGFLVPVLLASVLYLSYNTKQSLSGLTTTNSVDIKLPIKNKDNYSEAPQNIQPALYEQNQKLTETAQASLNKSQIPGQMLAATDKQSLLSAQSLNSTYDKVKLDSFISSKTRQPALISETKQSEVSDQNLGLNTEHLNLAQLSNNPLANSENIPLLKENGSTKIDESYFKAIANSSNLLFQFALDNQEWDNFLTKKIEDSITDGNTERSFRLISCLTKPEIHISSLAKLMISTRKEKLKKELLTKMEDKIATSPIEDQSHLLTVAGRYQNDPQKKNDLFIRAEKNWNSLSAPEKQLTSALRMAISHFKDGNIKSTNRYLMTITTLLPKLNIADIDSQIKSRLAISRAYKDTGNMNYALQWIKDSENLIEKGGETAIQNLVEGYAYLNKYEHVLRLTKKVTSINKQDELLYRAIRIFLTIGQVENAIKLNRKIQGSTYRALSYIQIASYSKEYQNYSILAESVLSVEVISPVDKAIVSSRLAQLYARQYNIYKTEKLLQLTKKQINAIPSSTEKDLLLKIVATNYARSLMFKPATAFASAIQSTEIQSKFYKEYSKLSEITAL